MSQDYSEVSYCTEEYNWLIDVYSCYLSALCVLEYLTAFHEKLFMILYLQNIFIILMYIFLNSIQCIFVSFLFFCQWFLIGLFFSLQDELNEVVDVKNPDITPASERREKRLEAEAAKFDPDHYLYVYPCLCVLAINSLGSLWCAIGFKSSLTFPIELDLSINATEE